MVILYFVYGSYLSQYEQINQNVDRNINEIALLYYCSVTRCLHYNNDSFIWIISEHDFNIV